MSIQTMTQLLASEIIIDFMDLDLPDTESNRDFCENSPYQEDIIEKVIKDLTKTLSRPI